ncbi:glycosyltransferase family 2 protein [Mucilaginibacter sp.]|uniref:glycosyltransferase family 2 protein n=1 Tax=Mucilaginibacter sp. TaxID=1882438 RepID=UPI000CC10549|nr:glycosyltransferase family 2 protein [Mucilaginibacter sp.]PLW91249.1 MAG: glycosyltransferase family 2 protein [Mucilaginibacter sp.]HEK22298.1 glycosyltransferase [Bacteroidota bacterium]
MNKKRVEQLVSVVIPCYNSEKTIIPCLESGCGQDYVPIEIIVVNDGSKDKSAEVIADFINKNSCPCKIILHSTQNAGPSSARNTGIELANGEFIAFLDADDQWLPGKLSRQMKLFAQEPQLAMIGANHPSGAAKKQDGSWTPIPLKKLLFKNYFQTSSVIVRAAQLPAAPFRIEQKYSEDYDLWLRLAVKNQLALIHSPATADTRLPYAGSGLSSRIWEMERGELSNYKRLRQRKEISAYDLLKSSSFSMLKFFIRLVKLFTRK